ncbi:MAG: tRNA (N6-isopentenyl adenosine(37)-C2)-methylthiotransferase MiaB [Elusimicrobia bacterium]|nr:tRNA (N6-isopentenyl adenosine(37)-C2)-methylthiotransferase MiaB [Elusimicrobiota bacterium]
MKTLHVVTFGCQMSVADGGEMAAPLLARGLRPVDAPEDADAILLNTCTVRQHAEDKALSLIGRLRAWKDADPARVLIVAGCAAERLGPWIQNRFPYVDLVVGAKSIEEFPNVVEAALAAKFDALKETREAFPAAPEIPVGWTSSVVAPVTIMRGCNYSCSYCIVPHVRGRESYRSYETVMAEIRAKAALGAREILLLGQTVNSWHARGNDGRDRRFADLLRAAAAVDGVARVRFESPHPFFLDDALIAAMAETPAAGDVVHMPLQSGSDRVLSLMRRNYTAASYVDKINRLRAAAPRIEVTTDIIVGFPSETDEDFQRTLDLVAGLRPASAYTFKYSPREGTESAGMADDVPEDVKEERLARLNALCDGLTEDAMQARVGRTVDVLDENGGYGRARDGFRVKWGVPAEPGRLRKVRVVGTMKRTLLGECDER